MYNDDDDFQDDGMADEDQGGAATGGTIGDDDDDSDEQQQQTLLTKAGFKKLKEELEHLKKTRRQEVALRLKEAISYGDLSENSEYEEAKNEQAFVEGRIMELEQMIKSAKIIAEKTTSRSGQTVNMGSVVTIRKKSDKESRTFTIVGTTEADPIENKISNESPIGAAIFGKGKGDIVEVKAPSGIFKYEILQVK